NPVLSLGSASIRHHGCCLPVAARESRIGCHRHSADAPSPAARRDGEVVPPRRRTARTRSYGDCPGTALLPAADAAAYDLRCGTARYREYCNPDRQRDCITQYTPPCARMVGRARTVLNLFASHADLNKSPYLACSWLRERMMRRSAKR